MIGKNAVLTVSRRSLLAAALLLAPCAAHADPIQDFYTGKTINIIVSTGPGSIFDSTARMLAKHMPRFIPGAPSIVVRNMPGAGHMRATQYMFAQAPRDGTYLGVVNNGIPLEQLVTGPSVRFDVRKFNWVGSAGLSNLLTMAWHTSGAKTIEDVMTREVIAGATGVSSNGFLYANVMNVLLGTKFKIVAGYGTSGEADLAMERGEVRARAGFSLSAVQLEHPDWIRDKKVNVLFQTGLKREASLPDVPLMHELAKNDSDREVLRFISADMGIARALVTTPGVPADRLAALRKAFADLMRDPEFLAEAAKAQMDISWSDGEATQAIASSMIDTARARAGARQGAHRRAAEIIQRWAVAATGRQAGYFSRNAASDSM